ncbi:MAG: bifunctional ornithine acetyltransferase/N-acetylglutamate synthase [Robiginitomaculum sp.]|nr:MAG: bifunctional ornithine acetyltransferase/N-acetylglutamate synthase [Robiginitomaculum sp.]
MKLTRSPLAPEHFPDMPEIAGIEMWVAETGAKYKNRPDVLLVKFAPTSVVAGVFTKSRAPGAPIDWSKKVLARQSLEEQGLDEHEAAGGLLVNAGNANVFTGRQGHEDVESMARFAAVPLGCEAGNVFICSTGVIGEPLDLGPLKKALSANTFLNTRAGWEQAARAISTTDTYAKGAHTSAEIDGVRVRICGIVKGSGMIAPDMATMLGFIFTDANIAQDVLQELLTEFTHTSFNAITVDSDSSTSDTVLLTATRMASHPEITQSDDPCLAGFKIALHSLMLDLAHQVVKDGEGAQKFIEIHVCGAMSRADAKTIGLSIANSPLVKTAIAGEDANWGRIIMAVGKSGVPAHRDELSVSFGEHLLAQNGQRAPGYDEAVVSAYMRAQNLRIHVDIGLGNGEFTVWTCDLTHGYIDINADYRS